MKKICLLLISLIPLNAICLPSIMMLKDGKVWNYYCNSPNGKDNSYYYTKYIDGDTIANGRECMKLFYRTGEESHLQAFLYEEGMKVYSSGPNTTTWTLLYDFSLNEGDQLYDKELGETFTAKTICHLSRAGRSFAKIQLEDTQGYQTVWVSGIGGSRDLMDPFTNLDGDYGEFISCEENGEVIFTAADFLMDRNLYEWKYMLLSDWYEQQSTYYGYLNMRWFYYGEGGEYDTMEIDGKTYTIIHAEGLALPGMSRTMADVDTGEHYLGIRKEGGRVYANYANYLHHLGKPGGFFRGNADYIPYPLTDDGEVILYDYTMEVGDKYRSVDGYDNVSVVGKDVVVLEDQKEHRRLTLSNGLVLIEDVGCINSPGMLINYLNPTEYEKEAFSFLEYKRIDEAMLYTGEHYNIVDKTYLGISDPMTKESAFTQLFDLQGRQQQGKPARGVYIRDGRKVVIK